ncbi:hypothetical protein LTR51_000251 [Lithohypha guttulata]|nr:hypothetical protein LTR51_000251 [Lithohypha guttulata]
MSTSAKRRRTSPTTYVPISDEDTQTSRLEKHVTPKRHLYRSPTKSSLARSHPKVLQQTQEAKERRESVPNRRQSLLDAVMNNKPLFWSQNERSEQPQPSVSDRAPEPVHRTPATPRASNVITDIASVFRDIVPRASSSRPTPGERVISEVQPEIPTPRRRWVSPVASPRIVPKLVKSASKIAAERSRRSSSVELPPTPVQLGKDPVPERPRGLLTSSPGGGGRRRDRARGGAITSSPLKPRNVAPTPPAPLEVDDEDVVQMEAASGIGDEDERTAREEEGLGELILELSQSEGEHTAAQQHEEQDPENETAIQLADSEVHLPEASPDETEHVSSGIDQEAESEIPQQLEHSRSDGREQAEPAVGKTPHPYQPEDMPADKEEQATYANANLAQPKDVESTDIADESDDPIVQGKIEELKALQAQLETLGANCGRIEAVSKNLQQTTTQERSDQAVEEALELLLDALPIASSTWPVPQEDAQMFSRQASKYLNLFAQSSLQLSHSTNEKTIGNTQHTAHQITLTAPAPWPASILDVNLQSTMDTSCNVMEIVLTRNNEIPHVLRKWIETRLEDPVLKCDLATIATGIGHYFREDVKRAKVFQILQNIQDPSPNTDGTITHLDSVVSNINEAMALLPYLNTSFHSFTIGPKPQQEPRTRRSSSNTQQIMLKYSIALDWIGQPAIETDICPVGFCVDTVKHTKNLFRQIQEIEGVVVAFQKVWELLGAGTVEDHDKGTMRKGKSRARRMTVFD